MFRHQICEFHIIKELTKAILRAVAKVRKKLAARQACLPSAAGLTHARGQAMPPPTAAAATENRRSLRASSSFRPA